MKKLISVLCIILVLSMLFCGCTKRTRDDITDDIDNGINDVVPNVSDTPASDRPTHGTDAPNNSANGNDKDVDILPDADGKTDGTDKDSGVDNNATAAPSTSPDASPAVSPAVSPIG